jgi:hypothetical protein
LQYIFTVNAGSNSVSILQIDASDPTKLSLIGQPVSSAGTFPISIDASLYHSLVCVANSGSQANLACASFSKSHGLSPFSVIQSFPLSQTTPPTGPPNTLSQVFYSEDTSTFYLTAKGIPMTTNHGFIAAYPIEGGSVSSQSTSYSPSALTLPFGAAYIPHTGGNVLISDPSLGGALVHLAPGKAGSTIAVQNITTQSATCWATYSPTTHTAFFADGGANTLTEVDGHSGVVLRHFVSGNGNPGNLDLAAKGRFVFALSPGAGAVAVFDVSGSVIRDVVNYKPEVESLNAMGMAVY